MNDREKLEHWFLRGLVIEKTDNGWEFGFNNEGEWEILAEGTFSECMDNLPDLNVFKFSRLPIDSKFEWNEEIWTKISKTRAQKGTTPWPMNLDTWVKPV